MWEQREAERLGFEHVLWCVCGEACAVCLGCRKICLAALSRRAESCPAEAHSNWSNKQCGTLDWTHAWRAGTAYLAAHWGKIRVMCTHSLTVFRSAILTRLQEGRRFKDRQSRLALSGWATQVTLSWERANFSLLRGSVSLSCPDTHTRLALLRGSRLFAQQVQPLRTLQDAF